LTWGDGKEGGGHPKPCRNLKKEPLADRATKGAHSTHRKERLVGGNFLRKERTEERGKYTRLKYMGQSDIIAGGLATTDLGRVRHVTGTKRKPKNSSIHLSEKGKTKKNKKPWSAVWVERSLNRHSGTIGMCMA